MRRIKAAVVGVGNIGSIHADIYSTLESVDLTAVCDTDQEKADKAASKFNCKAFYSVESLLAEMPMEIASVCTKGEENGGDHFIPTIQLLDAGVHTLGEKPISNNIEHARTMQQRAEEKKVRYGINLNHRFTPSAIKAKEWITNGRIGSIHMIDLTMWIDNPVESSPWFHLRALHPHSFNILNYFVGPVKKVHCFLNKGEGRKIWTNAQINLLFANGVIGHLRGSYDGDFPSGSFGIENLEIVGSKGRIVIENACESLCYFPRGSKSMEQFDCYGGMNHFQETFRSRIEAWVQDNINQVLPAQVDGSGKEGLAAQETIEAAIKSFETNTVVEL
jgi:predicted dehydrogenase